MLTLDDDELHAVALLVGLSRGGEDAAAAALGAVRLRARGLLSGPESLTAPRLNAELADAVATYLAPETSVAVAIDGREANLRLTLHRRGEHVIAHSVAEDESHAFIEVPDPVEALIAVLRLPSLRQSSLAGEVLELRELEAARQAAAGGDRAVVVARLQEAGAGGLLAETLAEALLGAERIAQLVRPTQRSLTVLIARGAAWTFSHTAERADVFVERASAQRIREQVAQLLAT